MKLLPAHSDDLLDTDSLPPTDNTELNYRPRPLSPELEVRLTLLALFGGPAILIALAEFTNGLTGLLPISEFMLSVTLGLLTVWMIVRHLTGTPYQYLLLAIALLTAAILSGRLLRWANNSPVWCCRVGLLLAWLLSALITRQVAAWILVNPKVDHETMKRWEVNVPQVVPHGLSLDCPELLTCSVSVFVVAPACWCAVMLARHALDAFWLWPLCFVATLHGLWLVWHMLVGFFVPWPNPLHAWRMTWQALVVFLTYDVYSTPAAGVFRFPTHWLRPVAIRWLLLTVVLLLLAFCCPSLSDHFPRFSEFFVRFLANLTYAAVMAPAMLATMLWFTGGTLLARFETELTADHPGQPTEWDIYVDRLVNSGDELESEHLLYGTTLTGDYPVLLHREILDQHGHLLGDTGASKTSLGIAPLATQLIARADSTVVVVDLKGDRALFETCRREAERTRRLRFRWLSNEVGSTTFAFNPFEQTHNQSLSPDQFVQQMLQGLSLDYGLQYGAGYFTAMNEIVLSTVLSNCRARSFRELRPQLNDQRFYQSIGNKQDWSQARHLAALVSRLAGSELLNVVPGMYADQPDVHQHAIDVAGLFAEPQVVYLSLRSSVEPTNAPAIARLFLWAMFTAASHHRQGNHRVYIFLDEFQQIISDGIKLIFEQFRGLGGTIIAAHQTAGQLKRQGTDVGETVDSCTAVKQVFRASDLRSQETLEKLAGTRHEPVPGWSQPCEVGTGDLADRFLPIHASEGEVRVKHEERPRLDRRRLQTISSGRQSSLVRFTFGSGYTQFAGATVPMLSSYPISFQEYQDRQTCSWPTAPGAFIVPPAAGKPVTAAPSVSGPQTPVPAAVGVADSRSVPATRNEELLPARPAAKPSNADFVSDFDRRGRSAVND